MILFKQVKPLKKYIAGLKNQGKTIGFIPTMGALHKGHLSLIRESRQQCSVTVCSIFVNPTQFNDPKDFEKYPVTIENDILLLEQGGADILFLPSVAEMYPDGLTSPVHYELGYLENILEGFYRPGHFQGVCQVVHRLLDVVEPGTLFLGRKDYQQCMVIKKLIELYNIPTMLQIGNTLREADGLAMSSRNLRLLPEDRKKATAIYGALNYIKTEMYAKSIEELKQLATHIIMEAGFSKIDYVEIGDAGTLLPVNQANSGTKLVALVAAFLNNVRLIDNMIIN
jgi:pantoate--beta-alanine ligase